MNIPKGYEGPVYFHWNTRHNFFCAGTSDMEGISEYVLLGQTEVSVEFADVRQQAADRIDEEIEKTRAELRHRIDVLEKKKQELLALEAS